jgi:hypothetical protein
MKDNFSSGIMQIPKTKKWGLKEMKVLKPSFYGIEIMDLLTN